MTHTQVGFFFFTLYTCASKHSWIIYISNDCATVGNGTTQTPAGMRSLRSPPRATRFGMALGRHQDIFFFKLEIHDNSTRASGGEESPR